MAESKSATNENEISRNRLAELLNEDLSREYQAIIAYVVYSHCLLYTSLQTRPALNRARRFAVTLPCIAVANKGIYEF